MEGNHLFTMALMAVEKYWHCMPRDWVQLEVKAACLVGRTLDSAAVNLMIDVVILMKYVLIVDKL